MRAAIYARYSSENQNIASIDAQVRSIKEFCEKNNHNIVETYVDEARSGTSDNRPSFLRMITDSNDRNFDIIIVHKLDRFARDRYDSAIYRRKLKNNEVKVYSVLENLNDSPESVMLESVLEGMAEYYSKNLAREVKKGLNEVALKGKSTGSVAPIGYSVNKDGDFIINEQEAFYVRKVFDLYINGMGYQGIANYLKEEGIKNKRGKHLEKTSIRYLLCNEKYIGIYRYSDIRIEDAVPKLIDKNIWDKVQEKFKRESARPRTSAKDPYMLTGIFKCGECGGRYVGVGKINDHYYYGCNDKKRRLTTCNNRTIRKDVIEQFVINEMREKIFVSDKIDLYVDAIYSANNKIDKTSRSEIKEIQHKYDSLKLRLDRLVELYLDGDLQKESYKEKTKIIEEEMSIYKSRILNLEFNDSLQFTRDQIRDFLIASKEMLDTDDIGELKKMVLLHIDEVEIFIDKIKTSYRVTPETVSGLSARPKNRDKVESAIANYTLSLYFFTLRRSLKILSKVK